MSTRPCKACGAQIIWIKTPAGKAIPCDLNAVYYARTRYSNTRVVLPNGEVILAEIVRDYAHAEGYGYIPHWSTCTNPDAFRRKGR